jgi:hypothetical protein
MESDNSDRETNRTVRSEVYSVITISPHTDRPSIRKTFQHRGDAEKYADGIKDTATVDSVHVEQTQVILDAE